MFMSRQMLPAMVAGGTMRVRRGVVKLSGFLMILPMGSVIESL
jgi:hypothetical protein